MKWCRNAKIVKNHCKKFLIVLNQGNWEPALVLFSFLLHQSERNGTQGDSWSLQTYHSSHTTTTLSYTGKINQQSHSTFLGWLITTCLDQYQFAPVNPIPRGGNWYLITSTTPEQKICTIWWMVRQSKVVQGEK